MLMLTKFCLFCGHTLVFVTDLRVQLGFFFFLYKFTIHYIYMCVCVCVCVCVCACMRMNGDSLIEYLHQAETIRNFWILPITITYEQANLHWVALGR